MPVHPLIPSLNLSDVADAPMARTNLGVSDLLVSLSQGRLTLTSGTPITTSDVTAASTLYFSPLDGNVISLWDGSAWSPTEFTEKSISVTGLTADKPYDIWGYLSGGALALESLVWTDDTTRATALARTDGVLHKSGDQTRRYLGSIRTISSSGTKATDSESQRYVYNAANRALRSLKCLDDTDHTYATASTRNWRALTTFGSQRIGWLQGLAESRCLVQLASGHQSTGFVALAVDGVDLTGYFIGAQVGGHYTYLSGASIDAGTGVGAHTGQLRQRGDATYGLFDFGRIDGRLWS